jgi:hypothetical protein
MAPLTRDARLTPTTVDGRPAAVVESGDDQYFSRAVLTHAPWGDLLIAGSTGPAATVPPVDALAELLVSARVATTEEWEAFVVEATGGPGLRPDDGAEELERGTVTGAKGEVEWLLQAWDGVLDPCLKLSNRQRACATGSSSDIGLTLGTGGGEDEAGIVPEFLMATVSQPGARLRVTTPAGVSEGTVHPLPGTGQWSGVVFADGVLDAFATCPGDPDVSDPEVTVELLDAGGVVVGCVGLSRFVAAP